MLVSSSKGSYGAGRISLSKLETLVHRNKGPCVKALNEVLEGAKEEYSVHGCREIHR